MIAIKDFNKRRAQFMKLAAAADLPPILVKLAYLIAFQEIDLKSQTTRRAHATFAAHMGVTERTVQRLLPILTKRCGLVVQSGRGRHQKSTYWIGPPPAEKATPMSTFQTPKGDMEKATPVSHVLNEVSSSRALKGSLEDGEGVALASQALSSAPDRTAAPDGAARSEEETCEVPPPPPEAPARPKGDQPTESPSAGEEKIIAAWLDLRALWVRPWPETAREVAIARGELVRAVREGANPVAIFLGARTWAAALDPRYLPPLWRWLEGRGWEHAPPAKTMHRASRAGYGSKPHRVTPAMAMAAIARELQGAP